MKETELAQHFVEYLSDMYDLYFEVGTIDIVGKKNNIVIAVEVKKVFNFKVIQQAYDNIRASHYSYVAVPSSSAKNNPFALKICEEFGIGVLLYNDNSSDTTIIEKIKPKLHRKAYTKYAKELKSDSMYKRTTPGAKSGDTITAFSVTVENLEAYVCRHNGCSIKDALNSIKHHYGSISSARSCIIQYIDRGVIKTIHRNGDKLYILNNRKENKTIEL